MVFFLNTGARSDQTTYFFDIITVYLYVPARRQRVIGHFTHLLKLTFTPLINK